MTTPASGLQAEPSQPEQRAPKNAERMIAERVQTVAHAARGLDLGGARWWYSCLSLCVLDAVFSPATRYDTVRQLVDRYAEWAGIRTPRVASPQQTGEPEQGLGVLTRQIRELGVHQFAVDVLSNRQRTYRSRHAPLKAYAAMGFAERIVESGVHTRAHLARLRRDEAAAERLDRSLSEVPGHGSGQRLAYFHVLAGDDSQVVPNRYLLAWLARVTGTEVTPPVAAELVGSAAAVVGVSPAQLADAVWRARVQDPPHVSPSDGPAAVRP